VAEVQWVASVGGAVWVSVKNPLRQPDAAVLTDRDIAEQFVLALEFFHLRASDLSFRQAQDETVELR
jgi:hypothetical protein